MKKYKSPMQTAYRKPVVLDSNDPRNKNAFELEKFRSRIGSKVIVKDFNNSTIELEEYQKPQDIIFMTPGTAIFKFGDSNQVTELSYGENRGYGDTGYCPNWLRSIYAGKNFIGPAYFIDFENYENSNNTLAYTSDFENLYFVPEIVSFGAYGGVFSLLYANNTLFVSAWTEENGSILWICDDLGNISLESSWSSYNLSTTFKTMAYGNSKYIASAGFDSGLYISDNGTFWTEVVGSPGAEEIIFYKNNFIAFGTPENPIMYSPDGENWTACITDDPDPLSNLIGGSPYTFPEKANNFIILSGGLTYPFYSEEYEAWWDMPCYYISYDGINWQRQDSIADGVPLYANNKIYLYEPFGAVSEGSVYVTSDGGLNWEIVGNDWGNLDGGNSRWSSTQTTQSNYRCWD